jgi:hypothetical protein
MTVPSPWTPTPVPKAVNDSTSTVLDETRLLRRQFWEETVILSTTTAKTE